MIQAELSSNFKLSIPKVIQDNLKLQQGQRFVLLERGHIIELIPMQSLQEARGSLAGIAGDTIMDYRDRSERMPD
ncbi:MAG: AbrB/MazE/SpoVT family DNA-binding domain-containing protein [Gammaproteobacteria bacterium]|nr:AbrB/MazE/SpoVT family DNA-binding domain-containing protein [Gammaproteobacteria bacterium]